MKIARSYQVRLLGQPEERAVNVSATSPAEAAITFARKRWQHQREKHDRVPELITIVVDNELYEADPEADRATPVTWGAA